MAILTEVGNLFGQQGRMAAAMRSMADGTVLLNRGMFPDEGSAFIGMALVAELIDVLGPDHVVRKGTVGIVAIGAHYLAFDNRMM